MHALEAATRLFGAGNVLEANNPPRQGKLSPPKHEKGDDLLKDFDSSYLDDVLQLGKEDLEAKSASSPPRKKTKAARKSRRTDGRLLDGVTPKLEARLGCDQMLEYLTRYLRANFLSAACSVSLKEGLQTRYYQWSMIRIPLISNFVEIRDECNEAKGSEEFHPVVTLFKQVDAIFVRVSISLRQVGGILLIFP